MHSGVKLLAEIKTELCPHQQELEFFYCLISRKFYGLLFAVSFG